MALYWTLFLCVASFTLMIALHDNEGALPSVFLRRANLFVLVLLGAIFASTFSEAGSRDYANYVDFLDATQSFEDLDHFFDKDPFFQLFGALARNRDGDIWLLVFLIAAITYLIKIEIFSHPHFKGLLALAILFSFSRFFLLHEFTQIRAALGIAFISYAVIRALERKTASAILLASIAAATHLSTVALFPPVMLAFPMRYRWKILALIFLSVFAGSFGLMFQLADISRLEPYLSGEYSVTDNTLISFYFLFKLFVIVTLLSQWRSLNSGLRYSTIISAYCMALTWIFLWNDALSLRLGELSAVFDCICFSYFFRYGIRVTPFVRIPMALIIASIFYNATVQVVNPIL